MKYEIVPQDDAWIRQAKKNLTALYENKPLEHMPFEFVCCDITDEYKPREKKAMTEDPAIVAEERRKFLDPELQLKDQLGHIASRVRQGFWDDSIMALHPLAGATGWLTEVFGGRTEWFAGRPPYPHPVIMDIGDVDKLKPDFEGSELYQAALSHLRYFQKAVGDKIPISAPDLQSPIDVASMILDYTQLIYAMMDDPGRVHCLMRMITEAMIKACREFKGEISNYTMTSFNWWMPRGIFLSDDLQAVLNPEFYREFAVPYNEMLAEEFGGLGLHSCGRIMHNVENVVSTRGLLGFNTHDPLSSIAPMVGNRVVPIVGGIADVIAPNHPECRRPLLKGPEELEDFWWNDFEKISSVKGQRFLYQCHALICRRKPQEAYDRMLALAREAAGKLRQTA